MPAFYKTVLFPIKVSEGDYCWGKGCCYPQFDNESDMLLVNTI